ncbi:Uncharacterised protein [Bordetella pertussis]|nr:Uncharacterised protein [Bordetella pertussis]CPM79226.1 Uncharacterised protein [Bordetella pertussis]
MSFTSHGYFSFRTAPAPGLDEFLRREPASGHPRLLP